MDFFPTLNATNNTVKFSFGFPSQSKEKRILSCHNKEIFDCHLRILQAWHRKKMLGDAQVHVRIAYGFYYRKTIKGLGFVIISSVCNISKSLKKALMTRSRLQRNIKQKLFLFFFTMQKEVLISPPSLLSSLGNGEIFPQIFQSVWKVRNQLIISNPSSIEVETLSKTIQEVRS